MTKEQSFIKSTFFYSIGVIGSKVVFFVLVPVFSFFLSKDEIGQYDIILISITLLTPLITVQLADGVYRYLLQTENLRERSKIITTGIALVLLGFLIFLIISLFINSIIGYKFYLEFLLLQGSSCLYFLTQQISRGVGKSKWYAFMGIVNAILMIAFSFMALLYMDLGLQGILMALFLSQTIAVSIVWIFGKIIKYLSVKEISIPKSKELVKYSWPLLPNALSWWLIDLGNRYIILFFLSQELNGIYAIAARYSGIIALVNSVFILTWQDYAIADERKKEIRTENFSKVFNRFIVFELSTIILLTASSKYIITFTTGSGFHSSWNYFPILLLSAGFSSFCAYYGALYLKDKNTLGIFTTTIIGGLVNVGISVLLISKLGLYAVAIGSLLGFSVTFLLRMKTYKLNVNFNYLCVLLLVYVMVFILQRLENHFVTITSILICAVLFVKLNYHLIRSVIAQIKR